MTVLADLPLAAYDCETTGVRVHQDRIVTASIVVIDGAAAARFNAFVGQVLADYRRIIL